METTYIALLKSKNEIKGNGFNYEKIVAFLSGLQVSGLKNVIVSLSPIEKKVVLVVRHWNSEFQAKDLAILNSLFKDELSRCYNISVSIGA